MHACRVRHCTCLLQERYASQAKTLLKDLLGHGFALEILKVFLCCQCRRQTRFSILIILGQRGKPIIVALQRSGYLDGLRLEDGGSDIPSGSGSCQDVGTICQLLAQRKRTCSVWLSFRVASTFGPTTR